MRKGEELKVSYYTSTAATHNNYITIYDIVPTIILIIYRIIRYYYY